MVAAMPVYIIPDHDAKLSLRGIPERRYGLSVPYLSAGEPLFTGYMQKDADFGASSWNEGGIRIRRNAGDCGPSCADKEERDAYS
jgi:hypothetical protein